MNKYKGLSKVFFIIGGILSLNGLIQGISGGILYVLLYYSIPWTFIILALIFDKKSKK